MLHLLVALPQADGVQLFGSICMQNGFCFFSVSELLKNMFWYVSSQALPLFVGRLRRCTATWSVCKSHLLPIFVLIADAGAPAFAPDEPMLEAAKKAGTNVLAAAFVPSRPQPNEQSSNGINDMSRRPPAASTSEGHTDCPAEVEEDKIKFNVNAEEFHPKSSTQHNSSDSFSRSVVQVRCPANAA